MMGFALGVLATLLVIVLYLTATRSVAPTLFRLRNESALFVALWDTFLRQTGRRPGPRIVGLTRQQRRRIARATAKRLV